MKQMCFFPLPSCICHPFIGEFESAIQFTLNIWLRQIRNFTKKKQMILLVWIHRWVQYHISEWFFEHICIDEFLPFPCLVMTYIDCSLPFIGSIYCFQEALYNQHWITLSCLYGMRGTRVNSTINLLYMRLFPWVKANRNAN